MTTFRQIHPDLVGFDRIVERMNAFNQPQANQNKYPPYNVIKTGEETFLVEMAVAGFSEEDFDIELHDSVLTISANMSAVDEDAIYLHKGISTKNFERSFTLADTVRVDSVELAQGMLTIRLVNEIPEEKKPRKIKIKSGSGGNEKEFLTE